MANTKDKIKCFFCKLDKNKIETINFKNTKVSACQRCSSIKGKISVNRNIHTNEAIKKVKCFFCKFEIKGKSKILNFKNYKVKVCQACNSAKLKMCAKKYRQTFLNCSTCDKAVKSNNSILCFICNKWTHQSCSGLSKAEINQIEKSIDTWMCKICKCDVLPFSLLNQVQLQSFFNSDSCLDAKPKKATPKRKILKLKPKEQCFTCKNTVPLCKYKNKVIIYQYKKVKKT